MREIKLTRGKVALVDDEDYEELNQYKWYALKQGNRFYAKRHIRNHQISMHHQVFGKPPLGFVTDHIDDNGLNNQKDNLRFVTNRENLQYKNINKSSFYPGVYWEKRNMKWRARIRIDKYRKHLGYFTNEEEAAQAYRDALEELENEPLFELPFEEMIELAKKSKGMTLKGLE